LLEERNRQGKSRPHSQSWVDHQRCAKLFFGLLISLLP